MTATPDIWRDGALDERRGAAFLSVSRRTFRTLRKANDWPRKRVTGTSRIVYPRSVLRAFLKACEDVT